MTQSSLERRTEVLDDESAQAASLPADAFEPVEARRGDAERITRPTLTYLRDALLRLRRDRLAMACAAFIAVVVAIGVVGPWFFPAVQDGVEYQNLQNPNAIDQSPSLGEVVRIVDDNPEIPADLIAEPFDTSVPLVAPEALTPPSGLAVVGDATVNGVTVAWEPLVGVSGYQVFRTALTSGEPVSVDSLVAGTVERGVMLAEIANPAQHSYTDGLGLDASETYAYSVVSYVENPETLVKDYSQRASVIVTPLVKTMKVSDAQAIDADVKVGDTLTGRPHPFGTDRLGRDVLARMIVGTRVDMLLALFVPAITIFVGLIFGAISGLLGGKVDLVMMRIVEIVDNFPDLLFFILLQVALGKGVFSLVLAMTLFWWAGFARIVRGEVLRLREIEFVQASKLLGASIPRLVLRHIAPNLLGIIIIAWSARIPTVIAFETFLSLLGLGLEQPAPSWGNVVFDAARRLQVNPLQFFLPASVLGFTLLAFYLLGNSLRDAFDPKLRGRD